MEGEPQEPVLSQREQRILLIREQLAQNASFASYHAGNERMQKELAGQRVRLKQKLAALEAEEQKPE